MSKELNSTEKGWYRNSLDSEVERYWNGKTWTRKVRIVLNSKAQVKEFLETDPKQAFDWKALFTRERIAFLATTLGLVVVGLFIWQSSIPPAINDQSMSHRTFHATPSPTNTKKPKPKFVETSSLSETSVCKIEDQRITRTQPNNVGFPLTPDIIPAVGTADIIVIAVDFTDAPGEGSPAKFLNTQMDKIQEWTSFFSEGKLTFNFQTSPDWIHVPVASGAFNIDPEVANGPNAFRAIQQEMAQEIINATGNQFDWSNVDGVLFQFPASIQGVAKDLGDRGVGFSTPQGSKNLFFWGGGQYHHIDSGSLTKQTKQDLTWAFWIHEMLHSQGLALHSPGNGIQTSLANNQYGQSLVLDAWETLLLGWMPDEKVFCASSDQLGEANLILSPIETKVPGNRMGVIKISESEALVIESRRATGYSSGWQRDMNGILVYRINTTLDNDRSQECCGDLGNDPAFTKWGYFLLPEGHTPDTSQGPMNQHTKLMAKEGDKVISDGIIIELIYSGDQDFVKITKQ